MTRTFRVIFDGEALRPEQPVDLKPNTTYLVTIEGELPAPMSDDDTYPLTEIARLATDMGVEDLSARHDWYAHGRRPDTGHGS
jgi:hypothetical protein